MITLAALRRTRASEYRDFVVTATLVPLMHVGLRVFDFRHVRGWLERRAAAAGTPRGADTALAVRDAVHALGRARRYGLYAGNCLSQSLVLWWRLRRRGIDARLQLGAKMNADGFAAHAWVEHQGRVLNDTQDVSARYAPLLPREPDAARPSSRP
jgi:hypothetical protein